MILFCIEYVSSLQLETTTEKKNVNVILWGQFCAQTSTETL